MSCLLLLVPHSALLCFCITVVFPFCAVRCVPSTKNPEFLGQPHGMQEQLEAWDASDEYSQSEELFGAMYGVPTQSTGRRVGIAFDP
jgi:hypothetical protein